MMSNVDVDRALRPHTFSWFQRETVPARRTWWDWLRLRHPTKTVWKRHVVVLPGVDPINIERFGGWQAILDAFLFPMILIDTAIIVGAQIEEGDGPTEFIPCSEQPRNPPRCYTSTHADRGDGGGRHERARSVDDAVAADVRYAAIRRRPRRREA